MEWGGLFQRPHHLALALANSFASVEFIQPCGLRNPRVSDLSRIKAFFLPSGTGCSDGLGITSNVRITRLPFVPFHGFEPLDAWNARVFSRLLEKRVSAYNRTILWIGAPAPFLKRALKGSVSDLLVFDWMDDYSVFTHLPADVISTQDWLVQRADLIFASASRLVNKALDKLSQFSISEKDPLAGHQKVCFLPNGVDPDHWKLDERDVCEGPNTIGYFGTISHWMDVSLIRALIKKRTDWHFVFIGPRADGGRLDEIFDLANCRHIPPVPYGLLPTVAAKFDVCWIPFRQNGGTKSINPVKVYEYLAMGKPVVSIPLPDLKDLREVIVFATGMESFEQAISDSLNMPRTKEIMDKRRAAITPFSWDRIGKKAVNVLKMALSQSSPRP